MAEPRTPRRLAWCRGWHTQVGGTRGKGEEVEEYTLYVSSRGGSQGEGKRGRGGRACASIPLNGVLHAEYSPCWPQFNPNPNLNCLASALPFAPLCRVQSIVCLLQDAAPAVDRVPVAGYGPGGKGEQMSSVRQSEMLPGSGRQQG